MLDRSQRDVTLFKATVYLQGFNQSNGAIRSASVLYHRSSKALYRIKAYRTGYLNISLVFQEIEFPSLPRSRSFKVQTVPNQFDFHILEFFSRGQHPKGQKTRVGFSLIRLLSNTWKWHDQHLVKLNEIDQIFWEF